jgi:hypothetical protein
VAHVYSRSLLETAGLAGDQGITPTSTEVLVVRQINIVQSSIIPVAWSISGSSGQTLFTGSLTNAGDYQYFTDLRIVIQPGGQLAVHTLASPIDLSIFGYALALP